MKREFSDEEITLCKMTNGNLTDYINTFDNALKVVKIDSESKKVEIFINGMEDELKKFMLGSNCNNMSTAKDLAKKLEPKIFKLAPVEIPVFPSFSVAFLKKAKRFF